MRRSGTISFLFSLGVHALLLGAVVLFAVKATVTPPKVHLVYGEVGSEGARGEIWMQGTENPPQVKVEQQAASGNLTDALDAQLMGGTSSALRDDASSLTTPLLMTADGAGAAMIFGSDTTATPKFHFSAPSFASGEAVTPGRTGAATGTDVASIPQPIYPKESRQRGEQGTVLLEVQIKSDGSIGDIKVVQHPGHERLVNAAIEAIKKARIDPAVEDGRPIASTVRVPFNFILR